MITKEFKGGIMTLKADCYWAYWCDIGITQEFTFTDERPKVLNHIELNVNEAQALILELQDAIRECRRIDQEYNQYVENGDTEILEVPEEIMVIQVEAT